MHHYAGDTILTGNSADFSGDTIVHDGQLTVDGDLSLSSDSIPDFELGSPGASAAATGISDRIDIIGDLALNGKLNLSQSNELQSDANEAITGNLILPFGLLLGSGITLAVDEQPVMSALPFRTCLPVGCIVPLLFDQATLDALRAGTTLTVTAQFSPNE